MSGNLGDLGFDANTVAPNSFDVLPTGEYLVAITESVKQNTKSGTGELLLLTLQVLEGPAKGRLLWDRLNIWNQNAKAAKIAKATLSAICRAVGVLTPSDSSQLHDKPLRVKVMATTDPTYGERNEIKAYKPAGAVQVAMAETAAQIANPTKFAADDSSCPF